MRENGQTVWETDRCSAAGRACGMYGYQNEKQEVRIWEQILKTVKPRIT